jgi:Fuc2NAc and GlcNAc transferase
MTLEIMALLLSAPAAWALTGATRRYALRTELLDHPGERSSHSQPTPRGGGLAIVSCFLFGLLALALWGRIEPLLALGLGGAGLLTAAVGFADDHGDLPIRCRLPAHLAAAAWGLALAAPEWLPIGAPDTGAIAWLNLAVALLATVWALNLYNFMDGIDGIAGMEAMTVAGGAVLIWPEPEALGVGLRIALLLIAGSAAGFLAWNWPPAKIFMGDVGSGFLGLVFALSAFIAPSVGGPNLWCWLILLGAFVVDATLTLGRRMLHRERWWESHRSHAYQRLSRRWHSHARVTLALLAVNLGWLMPLAWLASRFPASAPGLALLALFPLLLLALRVGSGLPDEVAS